MIAVLACGWLLGAPPGVSARKCQDDAACRDCFDRTLTLVEDCTDADPLIENRQARTQLFNTQYGVCAAQAPGRPGSCTLTIRALNKCGRTRVVAINRSWTTFTDNARRTCGRKAVRAANRARRQCLRKVECPCAAPTTTTMPTTTTTTITTTTSTTATTTTTTSTTTTTTAGTTMGGGTTSTTTTTTSTTSTTTGGTVPSVPNGSACQQACIRRVAGGCYSDCASSCGKAKGLALQKCQRACRNAVCANLRKFCAPTADTDFTINNPQGLNPDYFACCKVEGDCDGDGEDTLSCETTTTTTSTTTTSIASTTTTLVTTTTTLFPTTTTLPVVGG